MLKQLYRKSGWGNKVLKFVIFRHFFTHFDASRGYSERCTCFSKTNLDMICNELEKNDWEVTVFLS